MEGGTPIAPVGGAPITPKAVVRASMMKAAAPDGRSRSGHGDFAASFEKIGLQVIQHPNSEPEAPPADRGELVVPTVPSAKRQFKFSTQIVNAPRKTAPEMTSGGYFEILVLGCGADGLESGKRSLSPSKSKKLALILADKKSFVLFCSDSFFKYKKGKSRCPMPLCDIITPMKKINLIRHMSGGRINGGHQSDGDWVSNVSGNINLR